VEYNGDCPEDKNNASWGERFSKERRSDRLRDKDEGRRFLRIYNFMDVPSFKRFLNENDVN